MYRSRRTDNIEKRLRNTRPKNKSTLHYYIKHFLGWDIPRVTLTEGHQSLMDYIWYSFNADYEDEKRENADCISWASRGGGKTLGAAIVSALDVIFKPEIQIRILSGSGYQAGRMYEYFTDIIQKQYEDQIADEIKHPVRKTIMKNGASVEVLLQTEISVRGQHVHKLRCDEVELFKAKVYEAAQYTTMSTLGYTSALEVVSTMHKRRGLMKKLIDEFEKLGKPIFKWNIWDVIGKCERDCKTCKLQDYCQGRAKRGTGYYKVEDVITQFERAGKRSFDMEMNCAAGGKKKSWWEFGARSY